MSLRFTVDVHDLNITDGSRVLGRLSWRSGKISFKGDTDASAAKFFDALIRDHMEPYTFWHHRYMQDVGPRNFIERLLGRRNPQEPARDE